MPAVKYVRTSCRLQRCRCRRQTSTYRRCRCEARAKIAKEDFNPTAVCPSTVMPVCLPPARLKTHRPSFITFLHERAEISHFHATSDVMMTMQVSRENIDCFYSIQIIIKANEHQSNRNLYRTAKEADIRFDIKELCGR